MNTQKNGQTKRQVDFGLAEYLKEAFYAEQSMKMAILDLERQRKADFDNYFYK